MADTPLTGAVEFLLALLGSFALFGVAAALFLIIETLIRKGSSRG